MPNTGRDETNMETGFCLKFQEEVPLEEGCRHPRDYCPHRTACFLYLIWKEKHQEKDEDSSHQ